MPCALPACRRVPWTMTYALTLVLIDQEHLKLLLPGVSISIMATLLKVRSVSLPRHETAKYVKTTIFFPGTDHDGNKVLACTTSKFHIVNDLRANILIGNNIVGHAADIANQRARIGSCKVTINIVARNRGQVVRHRVLTQCATVPITTRSFPENKSHLLEPTNKTSNLVLFAHLVDHKVSAIMARNASNKPIPIPRKL